MSYGAEFYNSSGQLMFTNGGRTLQLITRGTATMLSGEKEAFVNTGISTAATRDLPLVLLDELNGLKTYSSNLFKLNTTDTWCFYVNRSKNNTSGDMDVNWFLYDTHKGIPAPTGYGMNIYNEDGEINFSTEVEFLQPLKGGVVRRSALPKGFATIETLPTKYLESRHIISIRREYDTSDPFTYMKQWDYIVRYNGNNINPAFEADEFYRGVTSTQDGGSGGTDGTVNYYGTYVPLILARHPDS
jgi:hypothetical protein